jgi:6-pyruvoyltetrahydropterin/6-carboxytetrahydropterin synthase
MHTCTKSYRDLPAAHRQPNHDGHCRLIHGHSWGFDITFACDVLDENGFVVDVGKLQSVKKMLDGKFDHTLLLNKDDPFLEHLKVVLNDCITPENIPLPMFADIVVVSNCGMEGLARYVFEQVVKILDDEEFDVGFKRNLRVDEVTCWEDSKNRATFRL